MGDSSCGYVDSLVEAFHSHETVDRASSQLFEQSRTLIERGIANEVAVCETEVAGNVVDERGLSFIGER